MKSNQPTPEIVKNNERRTAFSFLFSILIICFGLSFTASATEPTPACTGFRTQTQGGWGQCHQNGNNPGSYLFAHFASAFPSGLSVGCATNHLHFTSPQGVCDFLPSGTAPRALTSNTTLTRSTR